MGHSTESTESATQGTRIKHRVIGALVLIALMVIILPMALDFRDDYGKVISGSNIPPKPNGMRVEILPINQPARPPKRALREVAVAPVVDKAVAPPVVEKLQPKPELTQKPKPKPKPKPQKAAVPKAGWMVQVGSFANKHNALLLRDRLKEKAYDATIDAVRVDGKTIHRVRVGPLSSKQQAERVRQKIDGSMKLSGVVRRIK